MRGDGVGGYGISANGYSCTHGARGLQRDAVSWMTISDLLYKPKCGGMGLGVTGSQSMCTALRVEPGGYKEMSEMS